jgi:AraC family transcriptional regulator of adaptative response / DNA-3-methyladenine glycosylase II
MRFSEEACYRAICTRDYHFDGQFVRASNKLKVYCRPICATLVPKQTNCLFFASAAEAEACGFRPCRRCRPDLSPKAPRWAGTAATVMRALRLIAEGALNGNDVDDLASRVGVTDRHLRRLFQQHLGCAPITIAVAHRLHLARQLITNDDHSIIEIAYNSGFSSVRRFNDAFHRAFGLAPSRVRSAAECAKPRLPPATYRLRLEYRPPYDWDIIQHRLRTRAMPGVEYVGGNIYQRAVEIGGSDGLVAVRYLPNRPYMDVAISHVNVTDLPALVSNIRHLLDLDADLEPITEHLRDCAWLKPLIYLHPGVRVPGFWNSFEYVLLTILTHHVGSNANALLLRVIEACGKPLSFKGGNIHVRRAFPSAATLACFGDPLKRVGVPDAAAQTITILAARVADGSLSLHRAQSPLGLQVALADVQGISRRLAADLAKNILEQGDTFNIRDVSLMLAGTNGGMRFSVADVVRISKTWQPWRAYAAMLLRKELLLRNQRPASVRALEAPPLQASVDPLPCRTAADQLNFIT